MFSVLLSHLRPVEARHMHDFASVSIDVSEAKFCQVLYLALFCDIVLAGKTWHSAEFLLYLAQKIL